MTTPTNWPNPDQIGVPLFAEKDGPHVFEVPGIEGSDLVYYWHHNGGGWTEYNYQGAEDFLADDDMQGWIYKGPCLTPTQISEMLAGERERCADVCRAMSFDNVYEKPARVTLEVAYMTIRNLGAAS